MAYTVQKSSCLFSGLPGLCMTSMSVSVMLHDKIIDNLVLDESSEGDEDEKYAHV